MKVRKAMLKFKNILCFILLLNIIALTGCGKSQFTSTPAAVPTGTSTKAPINSPLAKPSVTSMPVSKVSINANSSDRNSTSSSDKTKKGAPQDKNTKSSVTKKSTDAKTKGKMIAIDAGHQSKGNYEKEPIGPGAKTTKAKVSSGTQGVYTGVAEYKLNLVIAKKVKKELIDRGYEVTMIRNTNNVNLSNRERAEIANESGADLFIRIHADGSTDSEVNGASTLYPSKDNPYVSELSDASYSLSKYIVDGICEHTDAKNRGAIARDDMSGINWCEIPVSIIEMGYMSNKKEDKLMQTKDYQNKIVKGICDGIDKYYEN